MNSLPKLYKRASSGATQVWSIIVDGATYYSMEGIEGGTISTNSPHICTPKSLGKKNEQTAEQQALKEATAQWTKKLEKGYCTDVSQIDSVTFRKPMKGGKFVDYMDKVIYPVIVQDKLNGIRSQTDAARSYSTGGKTFYTVPHIMNELKPLFEAFPDAFIDGEFYNFKLRQHLNRLVKIVNVKILPKHLTPELLNESKEIVQLHLFDGYGFNGITKDTPYLERHAALVKLIKQFNLEYVFVLPYEMMNSKEELDARMAINLSEGGEGLMIRYGKCPHKDGRSTQMLKYKHFDDDEFEVVDVQEGNGDWTGCAKRIVLKLHTPATNDTRDLTFNSNIEGGMEELKEVFDNRADWIGKMVTVKYQHFSEYGVPQLPWVITKRDYEGD